MLVRGKSKLTPVEVLQIFQRKHEPPNMVCMEFGVTEKTVRDIWSGRTWKWLTMHSRRPLSIDAQLYQWNIQGRSIDPYKLASDGEWLILGDVPSLCCS